MSTDQHGSTLDADAFVYGLLHEKPCTLHAKHCPCFFLLDKLYWLHILVNVCADQNIRLQIFTRGGSNYTIGNGSAIGN